jgi:signal peptide peptidase SppA
MPASDRVERLLTTIEPVWGIRPDALEAMLRDLPALLSARAPEAFRFVEKPEEYDDFQLRDGVAIVPVTGPIFKRGSIWSYLYGGTPLTQLSAVFNAALADPDVTAIVLDIDSPGGTVSGTDTASDLVFAARDRKPVVAFGNGMLASAAYWIGSAADQVVVERSASVGSIGILYVHRDYSVMDRQIGLKRTVLHAGKLKAVGHDAAPLEEEDRAIIQAELDTLYALFIDTVARNRGVAADTVREEMAEGRVFIGQQAVEAGLADATGTMQDALEAARRMADGRAPARARFSIYPTGAAAPGKEHAMSGKDTSTPPAAPKTVEELKAQFPELSGAVFRQGAESIDAAAIQGAATTAERDRLLALAAAHFGAEAAADFKKVVESGVTAEQYQAVTGGQPGKPMPSKADLEEQIRKIDAEKQALESKKAEMLAAIGKAGAENPGAGQGAGAAGEQTFDQMVAATMTEKKCGRTQAMQAVARQHPELHRAYLRQANTVGQA